MPKHSDPNERLGRILEAAYLYYSEGLRDKTKVGIRLQCSATEVSRLLKDAFRLGLLEINVKSPVIPRLERKLKDRWEIADAIVVSSVADASLQRKLLGQAAAEHADALIDKWENPDGPCVAISGGQTIWAMVEAAPSRSRAVHICPTALVGTSAVGAIETIDPAALVTILYSKSGDKARATSATVLPPEPPPFGDPEEELKSFRERPRIREVFGQMTRADVVYTSVGQPTDQPSDSSHFRMNPLAHMLSVLGITPERVREMGAVGDVDYCCFDARGQAIPGLSLFLSLDIPMLGGMVRAKGKQVVLIADNRKAAAVRAALIGSLCSTLITDEIAARQLCDEP